MDQLEAEKNALHIFIETLKREENALINGKMSEIDYLASNKSRLIEKMTELDRKRNEFLKQQGLSLEKIIINQWLDEQCLVLPEVKTLWHELLDLAKTAQLLSYTNGLIISNYLQHKQRTFAALHFAAGNVSLYGPNGQMLIPI
ncbi:MAG TPA: flagellar protein FlgN [Bacteroidia bacterium]|nr:flagellar protein FlgN [Bacteroidia bacterium]